MKKAQYTGVIRAYDMHSPAVRAGYGVIVFLCLIMTVVAVFPLIWVMLAGFKDLKEFMSSTSLLPQSFALDPFILTWDQLGIARNYLNSLISVAGSVVCAIVFNGLLGYGLGILKPRGYRVVKRLVMLSLLLPTTISIVPLFMNIQKLNLGNSFIPLWLSYGANAMYVILFVQFFESLPQSIIEAAHIDGASQLRIFVQLVLPISLPALATIGLFLTFAYWNEWYLASIYLSSSRSDLFPLQYVLVSIEQKIQFMMNSANFMSADSQDLPSETIRMAIVVIAVLPIMFSYPFFQKYFISGLTIGAVKG